MPCSKGSMYIYIYMYLCIYIYICRRAMPADSVQDSLFTTHIGHLNFNLLVQHLDQMGLPHEMLLASETFFFSLNHSHMTGASNCREHLCGLWIKPKPRSARALPLQRRSARGVPRNAGSARNRCLERPHDASAILVVSTSNALSY